MMGERTVLHEALFYNSSLEQPVPADHMLRSIDRFVDMCGVCAHLWPYYSETGRLHRLGSIIACSDPPQHADNSRLTRIKTTRKFVVI